MHTPVLLYKSGVQGVYITRTCFHDVRFSVTGVQLYLDFTRSEQISNIANLSKPSYKKRKDNTALTPTSLIIFNTAIRCGY